MPLLSRRFFREVQGVSVPAVTIFIPCYNGGRFLPAALASIAAQTYRDFETVIVDDGSTDPETIAFLDRLPSWARLVRQPNRGLAGARNTAFREARGEFVLPLDCDDTIEPDLLAETVPVLRAAPSDVAFVATDLTLSGARQGPSTIEFDAFTQLFHNQLHYGLLLRKSAWKKVGGYDETMRNGYEDWEFNVALIEAGYRGVVVSKPLFVYFISADGMLMSKSGRIHVTLWRYIHDKHARLYRWDWLSAHNQAANPLRRLWRYVSSYSLLFIYRVVPDAIMNRLHYYWLYVKRKG
jgi:glycosyltransferase involved in cell wall biosynthesis